jgi:hypothetical protein
VRNGTSVAVSIAQQLPPLFRLINRLDKEVVDLFVMRINLSLIKLNDSAPGSMDALCAAQSLCMVPSETLAVGARRPADPHREARQLHMEAQRVDAVSQHPAASPVLITDRQAAIFQLKMFAGRPGKANLSLKAALLNAPEFDVVTHRAHFEKLFPQRNSLVPLPVPPYMPVVMCMIILS